MVTFIFLLASPTSTSKASHVLDKPWSCWKIIPLPESEIALLSLWTAKCAWRSIFRGTCWTLCPSGSFLGYPQLSDTCLNSVSSIHSLRSWLARIGTRSCTRPLIPKEVVIMGAWSTVSTLSCWHFAVTTPCSTSSWPSLATHWTRPRPWPRLKRPKRR